MQFSKALACRSGGPKNNKFGHQSKGQVKPSQAYYSTTKSRNSKVNVYINTERSTQKRKACSKYKQPCKRGYLIKRH